MAIAATAAAAISIASRGNGRSEMAEVAAARMPQMHSAVDHAIDRAGSWAGQTCLVYELILQTVVEAISTWK